MLCIDEINTPCSISGMEEWIKLVRERLVELDMTQEQLAEKLGYTQGAVGHWLTARREPKLADINNMLNAVGLPRLSVHPQDTQTTPEEDGSPSDKDFASIPQLSAKGSSGNGYLNDHVEINGGLAFKRAWLKREGLKEQSLRVIYNHGESNWPTLTDGEVLLVDLGQIEPRNGLMFALFDQDGEIIIKRLIRDIAGGWVIRSDNQDKTRYPDMPVSDEGMRNVKIIGRVVWRGGGM